MSALFLGAFQRFHFIGIGGIGMSALAEVLVAQGLQVSGSDLRANANTRRLEKLGMTIFIGHRAEQIGAAQVCVVSTAVAADNPEISAARQNHIYVVHRAEILAELMRHREGIAVAGAHGKTTTSALIAAIMLQAKRDPSVVIGGILAGLGSNARWGQGDWLVAEADESDGSFLGLAPRLAVVTNIDAEHLDHWTGGLDQIQQAFVDFLNAMPFYSPRIICADDAAVQAIEARLHAPIIRYGLTDGCDYQATQIRYDKDGMRFVLRRHEKEDCEVRLALYGQHNVYNALASIAVAEYLGIEWQDIAIALASFAGVARRFEKIAEVKAVRIIDDYAHHPKEIMAVLKTARQVFAQQHLRVIFQPHRYTRTRDFWKDFAHSFNDVDELIITDIYAASEAAISGVSSQELSAAVVKQGQQNCTYVSQDDLDEHVASVLRRGDVLITMGAGDISDHGPKIAALLAQEVQP